MSTDRADLGWQFTGGEKWHWIASKSKATGVMCIVELEQE
jgi:hypothetical protein